jgi:hypothetical protein
MTDGSKHMSNVRDSNPKADARAKLDPATPNQRRYGLATMRARTVLGGAAR